MKNNVLALFLAVFVLFVQMPYPAFASEADSIITVFEDGTYCVTTIVEEPSAGIERAAMQKKTGHKINRIYDQSGELLFSLTVHGTFSYNGKTASATDVSYTYTEDAFGWSFSEGSASKSGATVTATGIFKYILFLKTRTVSVSLTCAPDGTLS